MAIANIRETAQPIRKGPPCEVCRFIATLSDQDAADLRALLSDDEIRYSVISDGLRDDPDTPADLPAISLSRHARGKCSARERLRG